MNRLLCCFKYEYNECANESVTSYFGFSFSSKCSRHSALSMANFDVRLMPEFSGADGEISIAEWYRKITWIYKLHKVTDLTVVIPLRLTGHAYKIYD